MSDSSRISSTDPINLHKANSFKFWFDQSNEYPIGIDPDATIWPE
jgi:hypothetical protein